MSDILPEPTDVTPEYRPIAPHKIRSPQDRRTISILIALVIVAVLCLAAGYIYDVINNNSGNNTRKQDLTYISNTLNDYHELYGKYPTLDQINSSTYSAFAPNLNRKNFKDPNSTSTKLTAQPSSSSYAYQAEPTGCNNLDVNCTGYKLIATLSEGKQYIVASNPITGQPATIK